MTTKPDPIETVVRRVARALTWAVTDAYIYVPHQDGDPAHYALVCNSDAIPDWATIVLAAYAEAELHDRGWMLHHDGNTKRSAVQFYHEAAEQSGLQSRTTGEQEYDPADPVSKAEAILRAIDEAIGGGG